MPGRYPYPHVALWVFKDGKFVRKTGEEVRKEATAGAA
jgi:hypothetical protein